VSDDVNRKLKIVHKNKIRDACKWQDITRTRNLPTVSIEQVWLLLGIREVPCTSLELEIGHPDWGISWLS
jgi:hypothetical protein